MSETREQAQMSKQVAARDRVHIKYCRDAKCVVEVGLLEAGADCLNLDHLLDVTEEQALHKAAGKLLDLHMDTVLVHGAQVGQGLALAIKETDPYVRDRDGNLTRKSDGTPVPRMTD